ncbi:MAG TPA: L-seryl-tRNA(Sec) selenium transferase [Thermoanaerobaculia bacterium]|nr:L-seryl-tRNA(Sec) selenium transferase [Thermoanaerobaculia bacterium]
MATPADIPPSIEKLLSDERGLALAAGHGRLRAREALREAADRLRRGGLSAGGDAAGAILDAAGATLASRPPAGPRPVVNATGVLLHTNLGRAPLAVSAREAVLRACGYSTLELDLATGGRGKRGEQVRPLLLELFAPGRDDLDALSVTNTAAALLLALDTVANGRPVAVSRGELVAIGGDFRVPSILARSGASLLEVGTTNKTTPEDYAEAIRAGAAAILKVRPSNYRIVGFTEEVSLGVLATLCREARIPLLFDAGAGSPKRFAQPGLRDEPVPSEALAEGADLVCFSGDKTLGGPQAGILLGAAALVRACAKNPLARALRPDKLVLAALAATLDLHLSGRTAEIPFHAMLETPVSLLEERARRMAASAASLGWEAEAAPLVAIAGGGTGTESTLASFGILLRHPSIGETEAAARLRSRELPVVVRISEGRLVVDLRSVTPAEDDEILEALEDALTRP